MTRLTFSCRLRRDSGFTLDAAFEAGDGVTALFGRSGSGKSTILAVIAGLLRPDGGRVELDGRILADPARGIGVPPERRGMGLVSQEGHLFPHLTVEENLRYGLRRCQGDGSGFGRTVEILELGPLLGRLPPSLSGGERQRTAIGRALLREPAMLLLDEPLASLDGGAKARILGHLERILEERPIPVVLVTHDQVEVRRLARRVVVLEEGRVTAEGPPASCLGPALLARLAGSLPRPEERRESRDGLDRGPVNLLRIDAIRRDGERWVGRLGGQDFHLPGDQPVRGSTATVRFLPREVILSRGPVAGTSIRNQLRGRVREAIAVGAAIFVAVDIGQFLWAEVTREALRELAIEPGSEVTCLIKARVLEPGA